MRSSYFQKEQNFGNVVIKYRKLNARSTIQKRLEHDFSDMWFLYSQNVNLNLYVSSVLSVSVFEIIVLFLKC